jgi:heavy metal translocating P-type ATPase
MPVKASPVTIASTSSRPENPLKSPDCQVVHIVPGRFRLRVPRLGQDSEYACRLNWFIELISFVISVRINPLVGSVIVHYESNAASDDMVWEALTLAVKQASTEEIPQEAIDTKSEFRPEINWLERLGLPVVSLGLAVVAQQLMLPIPGLLVGGVVAVAAMPFILRTVETTLKEKRLDADILDAIWLILYTAKGNYVAPALMVSLMESGEALRDTTGRATERQVLNLWGGQDHYVRVERDGQEQRIPTEELQVGDRAVVYPGERIPASGRVLRGTGLVDEHELTGESTLSHRSEGQVVHAATLLLEGKLCVLVKRAGKNTRVGLAVKLLQEAPVHDTRVEDYAAKLANMAIAPTLIMGGIIFLLTRDVSRALAPLHLDFSHGIRLSVPSTVLSALTYAARHGIYIRSGRALEVLSRLDMIAFDKTGTLTQGNAAIVDIYPANPKISTDDILTLAASAEQENTHPVAKAISNYATISGVPILDCEDWNYHIGLGIAAQIDGQQVLVGSHRLMQQEGVDTDAIHRHYLDLQTSTHSFVYVAQNGTLLGLISYTDPLRQEAAGVIAQLQKQGIETYMMTGDNQQVAQDVAKTLGIAPSQTYAEVLPQSKVEIIQQWHDQEKVIAFVGEGINDVAALAHADVSISPASGNEMARETADVVLLDDDLCGLTHAIAIAKRAMEIIYQNTAIVALPNIGVVLAGIVLALDPVLGVIISNGSMIVAELNSFRPLFDPGQDPFAQETEPKQAETKRLPANRPSQENLTPQTLTVPAIA